MSDHDESTDPELKAFEGSLKSLVPSRGRIDRDALIFRAGQVSARPPRFWVAAAASLAALAVGEAALLAHRPAPGVVERIVVVHEPAPVPEQPREEPPAPPPPAPTSPRPSFATNGTPHDRLTWQVLRYGLDGLPTPVKSAWRGEERRTETSRQMLQDELRNLLEPGDPS